MSLSSVAQGYQPKENAEFGGKKKLVGDAVCEVKLEKITAKKSGKEWIILKGEAINIIPDDKGRETTVEVGDEISKFYDGADDESAQELMDDLFTAGITFSVVDGNDEATFANMKAATDEKLMFFRTWAKDKPKDKIVPGKPSYYQNIKVLSASKLNAENTIRSIAF